MIAVNKVKSNRTCTSDLRSVSDELTEESLVQTSGLNCHRMFTSLEIIKPIDLPVQLLDECCREAVVPSECLTSQCGDDRIHVAHTVQGDNAVKCHFSFQTSNVWKDPHWLFSPVVTIAVSSV